MTDTANLEGGFYWARNFGVWHVVFVTRRAIFKVGDIRGFPTDYFDEIDPRPIKREDVK